MRIRRTAAAAPAVAALALLAAGCGGGSTAGVASLGKAATTTAKATKSASSQAPSSAASSGGPNIAIKVAAGAKFSQCMRKHGVPNFPDPNAQGAIAIGPSSGIDPSSPKFQQASNVCRAVLPNGGQPTAQQQAKLTQAVLAFSACMRAHGLKDFPDPQISGGHFSLQLKGGPNSDLNPNSPVFQKAQAACQSKLPGKVGGG
jgi:hypothetical protein